MRGRVLGFDGNYGQGHISGEDGQRYPFSIGDWNQPRPPQSGELVDFQAEEGKAVGVYRIAGGSALSGEKNKIVAALLALFLGGLGIHKFYLGKPTAGIIMLLASIFGFILLFIPTFVIGVIAFIEFIIYLVTPEDEFDRRYVQGDRAWF